MAEMNDLIEIRTQDIENKEMVRFFDLLNEAQVTIIEFQQLSNIIQVDFNPIFPSFIGNLENYESKVHFLGFNLDLGNAENLKIISESVARIQEIYQHFELQKFLGIVVEFSKNLLYLVYTECPAGENLVDYMKKLEFEDQRKTILQLLLCHVAHNHLNNIFHLDIRPANILVQANEKEVINVSLINYGLRKLIALASSQVTSVIFNCSIYQPPECFSSKVQEESSNDESEEKMHSLFSLKSTAINLDQIKEESNDDSKIDVWSLGCLISQFYSGLVPWHQCKNFLKLEYYLSIKKPFSIPSIDSQVIREIVKDCTSIVQSTRPSVHDILKKLELN